MKRLIFILSLLGLLIACSNGESIKTAETENQASTNETNETYDNESEPVTTAEEPEIEEVEEPRELTPQEQMVTDVVSLIDKGEAFDAGSYIKGDIPKGEYAFVTFDGSGQYYEEEDSAGNIIDNENFDSFGYVQVHEVGNIENSGALVKIDVLSELGVSGAKELYEILNGIENFKDAGWYKVGVDIEPGEYIIESYGEGYVAVMAGPVGNGEIIDNENFNGRYSVNVTEGQYLVVSSGTITTE